MRSLVDGRRKVSLRYGAMLEDKHCFKFGGVITSRTIYYCGILCNDPTPYIESKSLLNVNNIIKVIKFG